MGCLSRRWATEEEEQSGGWSRSFLADICGIGLSGNQEPYLSQGPRACACFHYRRDFGPHKVLPVKIYQPEQFVPSEENMDLLTTYKQDYNPYPICRVEPIKPRDSKYPCGDRMESLPTYKGGRCWGAAWGRDEGEAELDAGQEMCLICTPTPLSAGVGHTLPVGLGGPAAHSCTAGELRMVFKI